METKEIQKLIDFIAKSDLDEVNIETGDLKIKVKRNAEMKGQRVMYAPQSQPEFAPAMNMQPFAGQTAPVASQAPPAADTSNLLTITSPMIGTFYRSAGPEKPDFVEIGDEVEESTVVCIIEAMKLFNEIESEVTGKIVKVLVEDATPVEFDQPLFLVEPN